MDTAQHLCSYCKLEQIPQSTASREAVFGNQQGLKLYTYSFYSILPKRSTTLDEMSDYLAVKTVIPFGLMSTFASVKFRMELG